MLTRAKVIGSGTPGAIIHEIRKAKGLTIKQVATLSGVTESAISKYENDKRTPSMEIYSRILDALNADIYIMHD